MRGVATLAVFAVLAGLLTACGASRQSGLCADDLYTASKAQGDIQATLAEADAHWKKRGDIAELRAAIAGWEKAIQIDPTRTDVLVKLSRGWYFLGDGHLRFDDEKKDEMLAAFEKGTYYAEVALRGKNPEFRRRVCANEPFEKAIKAVDKGSVPAVYWYATNLGKWGLSSSIINVLENKDKVAAMIETARKLDPTYFYGAPDRYFGAYYTKIPFPNGDPKRSAKHFQRSLKVEPNYFATRVLMAEMLAPKIKDRKMFKEQLEYVINASPDVIPDIKPEQEIEQRKAKTLLEDIDILFEE
jgi:tetratricopeptide (TPR) repeat protein